jgi:SAM-dependent methyltransferase
MQRLDELRIELRPRVGFPSLTAATKLAPIAAAAMIRDWPAIAPLLLDGRRASFPDLPGLATGRRGAALDLGAGLGAVSLKLAERFERAYAQGQSFRRLAFLKVAGEQEGAGGIVPICHSHVLNLPFGSNALDAVVMIGVFEYLPLGYPDRSLMEVQGGALAEIHRVLAPGGVLFMATGNRCGWTHWLGKRHNSGLRFGTLLPRRWADRLSRVLLDTPSRVPTDSLDGCRDLLGGAGFPDAEFYWPPGGYKAPEAWVRLNDREAIRRAIAIVPGKPMKKLAWAALAGTGLLPYLVPHFGIVARKPRDPSTADPGLPANGPEPGQAVAQTTRTDAETLRLQDGGPTHARLGDFDLRALGRTSVGMAFGDEPPVAADPRRTDRRHQNGRHRAGHPAPGKAHGWPDPVTGANSTKGRTSWPSRSSAYCGNIHTQASC